MADLDKLRQESAQLIGRNGYYKGLNSKNAQNLAVVDNYIIESQSLFDSYNKQCQDLKLSKEDAWEAYNTAKNNYSYCQTSEAKEMMQAAQENYVMIAQQCEKSEAEKDKIEREVLDLRSQKDVIVEDKKVTEQEIEKTGVQLEKIEAEIKKAEKEIKDSGYSKDAAGSCQKGIDTIFGLDNSKKTSESTTVKKSSNYSAPTSQTSSSSSTTKREKKSNGMWWSASRDFDL